MLIKKITRISVFLILIFIAGCFSKIYEIDRSSYSLDEIYEMLGTPLSKTSRIIGPSISGRVTRHDFQNRGLDETESEKIINYLKIESILDAEGEISDNVDLAPGKWIKLDRNNSDIQNILKVLEENYSKGSWLNTGATVENLAYSYLESLINVVLSELHPKYSSKSGYSYFMEELEGYRIKLGIPYKEDHEYRFESKGIITDGIRVFRDKNNIVKIRCAYDINSKYPIEWELSAVISELSGDIVVDKLTETDGYIVFLVKTDYPEDLIEKEYYLMMARAGNMSFIANISRSLFTKAELKRMDSSIRRGPEVWEKYFRAEPAGTYLPGSGPDEGVRPGSGEVIAPYVPKQEPNE